MLIAERVRTIIAWVPRTQRRHAPPPSPSALTCPRYRETATDPPSEAGRSPQSALRPAAREITHNKPPLRTTTPVTRPAVEVGGAGEPSYLEDLHMGTSTRIEGIGGGFLENYPTARYGRCHDWELRRGRRGVRRRGKALGNDNRAPESAWSKKN